MRWRWSVLLVAVAAAPGMAHAGEPTDRAPDATGAQPIEAGAAPVVELYTMGQGDEVFEKFGHAALCVTETLGRRRTTCYNYGTTDFDALVPLFWNFFRGKSDFWVSTSGKRRMVRHYRAADRTLWRQLLPLQPDQARELAHLLRENARDENRYYEYHHYSDNCSTRVRDLIDKVTGGALSASRKDEPQRPTLREMTRTGFASMGALVPLSDLLLGRPVDQHPSTYEAMFLPDVLRSEVEARFGARPVVVYQRRGPPFSSDPGMGGRWLWVVLALAFTALTAAARRFERRQRLALAAAAFPLALFGVALWGLAAISSLPELRWNEAVLVFLPTDAALPFLSPLWRTRYAVARAAQLLLVALLLAVGLLVQPLWLLLPMPLLPMLLLALPRRALSGETSSPPVAAPG